MANKTEELRYPGGVYISMDMTDISSTLVMNFINKYLPEVEANEEQHCTLIYSKKPLDEEVVNNNDNVVAKVVGYELFGEERDILVAKLNSPELIERNKELVEEYSFISDFDEYRPHFTLAYNAKDVNINELPLINFNITLINEHTEHLDIDWSN